MATTEAGDEVVEALDHLAKVSKMKTTSETIKITEDSKGAEATTGGGAEVEKALDLTALSLTLDRRNLQNQAGEGEEAIPGAEVDLTVKGEEEVDSTTVKEEEGEDSRTVKEEEEEGLSLAKEEEEEGLNLVKEEEDVGEEDLTAIKGEVLRP